MWPHMLTKWRADRGIIAPSGQIVQMVASELSEYNNAVQESNPAIGEYKKVDALADILVLVANELALMSYDIDKVMLETIREISSRDQDPEQAARNWDREKWQKDANQPKSSMYKADYSDCKITDSMPGIDINEILTSLETADTADFEQARKSALEGIESLVDLLKNQ